MNEHKAGGGISGILDIEDTEGRHHVFHFSERGGRLVGACYRMLLGVIARDENGPCLAYSNPQAMLRLIAAHSVPCRSECNLMIVLCNLRRPPTRMSATALPEHIHARQCAVSLHA